MVAKVIKPILNAFRNNGLATISTACFSKRMAKNKVAIVILVICPTTRMVDAEPDASPNWFFFTELMMVFMLGDEKRAKPVPTQKSRTTISAMGVVSERKAKAAKPMVHIVMPMVAR